MTRDSNRRISRLAVGLGLALALGCARSPSTTPLSAASPTEGAEGPRSDRRAKPEKAPPAAAAVAVAALPSANPAPSAKSPAEAALPGEGSKKDELSSAQGPARVELLDPGKEPRRKLRFTFHARETLKIRIRNDMSMEIEVKNKTTRQRLPSMEMEGAIETLSVDAQGSARRRNTYSSLRWLSTPGVTPELQKRVEKQLESFAGITVSELVTSRGESLELEVDLSSIKNPELKTTLEGMTESFSQGSAPFPEEAVGVGARWRIQRVSKQRELSLSHDTTMRLTSLKGDRLEAEFTGKSSGSGTKAEAAVESSDTTMSGQQRVTLNPFGMDTNSTSESAAVTRVKDARITVRMSMKFSVSIHK